MYILCYGFFNTVVDLEFDELTYEIQETEKKCELVFGQKLLDVSREPSLVRVCFVFIVLLSIELKFL